MISYAILVVQFLCLSLWVGGSVIVLMIVGPEVFRNHSITSGPEEIMTRILVRFNAAFLISVFVLAGTLYLQLVFLSDALGVKLRIALSFVMLAALFGTYVRFTLVPRMKVLGGRESGNPKDSDSARLDEFRKLHGRFLGILAVNLFFGIGVVIILILPIH